ncbi:hypothetical protein EV356DRAFT_58547 [Viridothelium virens]|uniref:Uncharacterized protein n=1 Tax=Viridothelium virens TaxID=1048519 RepID=A0A6A6GS39_VIRVR|nr:hypothetical protein EV356DRAFT_58547 [Viridothelium virens]
MMIMLTDPSNEGHPEFELKYRSNRVEMKAVVDRIISSVWLNIVNPGKGTEQLPAQLEAVCDRGHHLNGDKLGMVAHALRTPRDRIIIESEHLLKNLSLWLMLHFHGRLIVSVSGKVLYDKCSGDSPRILELKVKKFCSKEQDCSNEGDTYRLFTDVRGSFEEFLSGTYPSSFDMPETARARRSLYDVMKTHDLGASVLSEELKVMARQSAQLVVKWLLLLPVTIPVDADFGFSIRSLDIDINTKVEAEPLLGTILGRSPSILNFNWGKAFQKSKHVIYAPTLDPENSDDDELSQPMDEDMFASANFEARWTDEHVDFSEDVILSFPILRDLVSAAKAECECQHCVLNRRTPTNHDKKSSASLQPGCKARVAVSSVLLLVSHAIADGFGAPDISRVRDCEHPLKSILTVFSELLLRKQIRWDTWFNTAACVYLGCPFVEHVVDIELGGTAYGAIQYGNAAVMAPWIDLTKVEDVKRCFHFSRVQGKLGVMRGSAGQHYFRGIPEQFAIVQVEHTEDTSSFNQRFKKWSEPLTDNISVKEDDSTFEVEAMLVSADVDVYRLLLRIKSDTFARIIDPVDAMIRLARSLLIVECGHKDNTKRMEKSEDVIKLYDFDDLLGRWQNEDTFYGLNKVGSAIPFHGRAPDEDGSGITLHMTSALQHNGKINVARALSVNYMTIVNQGDCFLPCAIQKAKTMPVPGDNESLKVTERYIINVRGGF